MNRKTEDLERVVKNALVVQGGRNQEERVREIGRNLRKAAASHASKDLMVQMALAVIQTGLEQEESTPATLAEARLRGRLGEWEAVIEMSKERKKTVERLEILEAGIEGTGEGQTNARERLRDEIGREGREAIGQGVKEDERLRLAGILYASDPDTATEVLRSGARHGEQKVRLETAIMRIRTVAALERMRAEVEGREEEEEEGEDEKLAEMLERGALAMSSKSANGVIKATRGIRDDGTKARILSQWVKGNAEHPEACSVAILAMDTAIRSKTYIPDGLFFEEVAEVLGRRKGRKEAELANKVEWQQQEGISIEPKWAGAKVKVRCMAQKWLEGETEEGRLDLVQCYEEFIEKAEEDQETGLGDRLTCAAIVVAETRRLEKEGWNGDICSVRELGELTLRECMEEVERESAEQVWLCSDALRILAKERANLACELSERINTAERRAEGRRIIAQGMSERICSEDEDVARRLLKAGEREEQRELARILLTDGREEKFARVVGEWAERSERIGLPLASELAVIEGVEDRERWKEYIQERIEELEEGELRQRAMLGIAWRWWGGRNEDALDLIRGVKQNRTSDRLEHGYWLVLQLAIETYWGKTRVGGARREDVEDIESWIRQLKNVYREVQAWSRLSLVLRKGGDAEGAGRIVRRELLPAAERLKRSEEAGFAQQRAWDAWYAAVWMEGRFHAEEGIRGISRRRRDRARYEVYLVVRTGRGGHEANGIGTQKDGTMTWSQVDKVLQLAGDLENDQPLAGVIEGLSNGIVDVHGESKLTKQERREIAGRVEELGKKFPTDTGVQHSGFEILVRAEIARIRGERQAAWESLVGATEEVPNKADQALILAKLLQRGPRPGREGRWRSAAKIRFHKVLAAIRSEIDRWERAVQAGTMWAQQDGAEAQRVVRSVIPAIGARAGDAEAQAEEVARILYAINPEGMRELGILLERDGARVQTVTQIKHELNALAEREEEVNLLHKGKRKEAPNSGELQRASWRALAEVNAKHRTAATYKRIGEVLQMNGTVTTEEGHPILAWAVGNCTEREGQSDERRNKLNELWIGLKAGIQIYATVLEGIGGLARTQRGWKIDPNERDRIYVGPGEREKGLRFIQHWLRTTRPKRMLIVDPYLSTRDHDILELIGEEVPGVEVEMLIGPKGHGASDLEALCEDWRNEWRSRSSEPMPEVTLTIAKKADGSQLLHTRCVLGDNEALEINTGLSAMGREREGSIQKVREYDFHELEREMRSYSERSERRANGIAIIYEGRAV